MLTPGKLSGATTTWTLLTEVGMSRSRYPQLLPAVALLLATALHAQNPSAASAPDLSDPEVAHVAVTANSIDIDLAKFAQTRTTNAGVKQFAATMITDHSAVK